jgi:hypothetical protein
MADLVEFWAQRGKIFVEHNSKIYLFTDFLKTREGKSIIDIMFREIVLKYPDEIKDKKSKWEIVGNFIKKHFLKKDKIFDVVIHNDGKVVKFNFED